MGGMGRGNGKVRSTSMLVGRRPTICCEIPAILRALSSLAPLNLYNSYPHPFPLSPGVAPLPCRTGRYIGGRSDPHERRYLLRLLFDPRIGLGLTRVRYQIPPAFNPATSPGVWSSCDHEWSSYLQSTKGAWRYNLSADWKQVLAVQVSAGITMRAV